MPDWDAELYMQFADERTRPSVDLLSRVQVESPRHVVDLGCGPGNSTAALRRRWPHAAITGVDNSPDMLAEAARRYPDGRFVLADIASWSAAAPVDVIFANASLHWVPHHATLFPRLLAQLASGGVFAVQMPFHLTSPLHRAMRRVAEEPEWCGRMQDALHAMHVESPAFYYDVLSAMAGRLDIWETEYHHVMPDPEAIVTWIRGSGLRPFLEALSSDHERHQFEDRLLEQVQEAYPRRADGLVLFPFRRLFIVAQRYAVPPG